MKTRSETVSFRADSDLLKHIDEACERFGLSRGSWVRGIIIAHTLRDDELREVRLPTSTQLSLDVLQQNVARLQISLARAAFLVLTKVGQMPTDEARQLVRSKLMKSEEE